MSDRVYLTRDGYNRLKEELYDLLHVTRPEVLEKIAEARSHGDLSENAEYDAAREQQSQTEARISDLEGKLSSATILDPKHIKTDKVYILTSVELLNLDDKKRLSSTPLFQVKSPTATLARFQSVLRWAEPLSAKRLAKK